ncbi:MAG: hypothetical protein DRQ51_00430 [Gammaproteobacteria bacterium]|nr:MAG: hypothetical protein DRQ51_00430 [Gammaproteobacteria bacterium]
MNKILVIFTLSLFVISCSTEDNDDSLWDSDGPSLVGTWQSNCYTDAGLNLDVALFPTYNDADGTATFKIYTTNDATCGTYNCSYNLEFDYSVLGPIVQSSEKQVHKVNNASKKWTNTCGAANPTSSLTYDIYQISSNGDLKFGDDSGANDGSTEALRPTSLNNNIIYTK